MSSFKRKIGTGSTSQTLPAGTKTSASLSTLLLTSSGIPSLDDVLGGGIQLGTSLLVLNPDPHSSYAELLQKYFIAQGLACGQQVYVFDPDGRNLAESCMWMPNSAPTASHGPDEEDAPDGGADKIKIAWRYERMQKFKTTVSSQSSEQYIREDYCRPLDLSQRIPTVAVKEYISAGQLHIEDDLFGGPEDAFATVARRIEDIGKQYNDLSLQTNIRVFRICIPSLGGPLWGDPRPENIARFLLRLRFLLRSFPLACALAAIPSNISSDAWGGEGWIEKLAWMSDACITLNSFTVDPATAALFPSHHGILKIHKLPCVQTLVPVSDRFSTLRGLSVPASGVSSGGVGENNLAFKCMRKRYVIETFHLDVEGGLGERRTTPAVSTGTFQEIGGSSRFSQQHHSIHDFGSFATVEIKLDETNVLKPEIRQADTTIDGLEKKAGPKKQKKRVGFQVERPDLYDL
ncbi:hypothetical protein EW145_g1530 [Phellinidium pouzarii]|uniref:Elongator complex protein 4 n=1 Tax=Phellinidium pouzarii TaxID=167371 RepID=A0A4S4LER3_9AGAM|nr:hypothetical protein EW145_g1530 [Phellinidium pouzarii]